jgi:hypothetical protein
MNTIGREGRRWTNRSLSILFLVSLLAACAGSGETVLTPFLPPTPVPNQSPLALTPSTFLVFGPSPTPTCTNDLSFIQDVTIPDNTSVTPGSPLDKQWQLQNSGTCNWDSRYRLRFIDGDPLGAATEQALYPARAGTKFTLRILFTAPSSSGTYTSDWQAYDPQGVPFGVSFFIKIVVTP